MTELSLVELAKVGAAGVAVLALVLAIIVIKDIIKGGVGWPVGLLSVVLVLVSAAVFMVILRWPSQLPPSPDASDQKMRIEAEAKYLQGLRNRMAEIAGHIDNFLRNPGSAGLSLDHAKKTAAEIQGGIADASGRLSAVGASIPAPSKPPQN